jgi:SnoaL-like domain
MPEESEFAETVDYIAITRLQSAYADVVNRRAWVEFDDLFLADATVALDLVDRPALQLVGPAEVGAFIGRALEEYSLFEFVILNMTVDLWPGSDRDAAIARIFMCEIRAAKADNQRSTAFGVYFDRYQRTPAGWRIASRRYRSLARFPDGVVLPPPEW